MTGLNSERRGEWAEAPGRLTRILFKIQALHGLAQILKALAIWCLLASFIRGRMGWETVNLITAVSVLVFLFREWPTRRFALRRLESLRPDSDFRFTTVYECPPDRLQAGTIPSLTILKETCALLGRPTPYLCLPGFAFAFRICAASISFALIWAVYQPGMDPGTTRLPTLLRIKLPHDRIRAGTAAAVQVFTEGRILTPRLEVRPMADELSGGGAEPAVIVLKPSGVAGAAVYEAAIPRVAYDLRLTAVSVLPGGGVAEARSPDAFLHVIHAPTLAFSSVLVIPPPYTKLQAEEIRSVGSRLSVYPGSEISMRIESNMNLSSVSADFGNGGRGAVRTNWRDKHIEVKGKIRSSGVLQVTATSVDGLPADPAFRHEIDTLVDRIPTVAWTIPRETRMDAPVEGMVPMRWQVDDDFGLSAFRLRITSAGVDRKVVDIPFLQERRQTLAYLLDVSAHLSYAGSEIEIVAEAADNDDIGGPKVGTSSPLRIRAPTVMDVYQRLTEQGAEVSRIMERLSGESTRLLKKMAAAARTLKAEGKMAWQMEQELVSMAETAQQAKRDAEKALAELGRRTESASRQNLLSRETLQKLTSIGSMMSNLLKEDYIRAQRDLSQALTSVRLDEKERSMQSAKFNTEQFVEQVDRTHRMLSRVTELMAQAEANKSVKDLVERVQKAMADKNPDRLNSLGREASSLMPKLQELAKDPAYSELKKALSSSALDLPKQFDQAAQSMRDPGATPESAKAAEEKLKKALDDLQSAMQKGAEKSEAAEKQNAAEKLDSLIDGLIFSLGEMQSAHEYFLSARMQHGPEEYSRRLQKAAALEPILAQAVADVSATAERLILFDPRPLQLLTRAMANVRSLSEHDEDPAAIAMRLKLAYRFTASAALQLLEISKDLQKQGGGKAGQPMQDLANLLQQLISAQSALNRKTELGLQLGQFGQNLEQLAFQQELIRRSMEAEAGRFSELQEKLGRIDQLLQEMRKAEEDLRKLGPTPDVQSSQQKILNKLMELQQSLTQKEEKEEKFEAEPFFGKMSDTSSLRLDRPKIDEAEFIRGLPPEYRDAGRRYLRSLLGEELQ